ncbi:unnamed protein product, partial [Brenthis ino]
MSACSRGTNTVTILKEANRVWKEEDVIMPKTKKKSQSREELLEKKRRNERERYARIKKDPTRLAAYKEKDKRKYLKRRATGALKTIHEMTEHEKRQCRKSWKPKYYNKKCVAKKTSEDIMRANTRSNRIKKN